MTVGAFIYPNISTLLDAETEFARTTHVTVNAFAPQLLDAFDTALGMYTTFGRIIGQSPAYDERMKEVDACAKALGAVDDADLARIRSAGSGGDATKQKLLDDFQAAYDGLNALILRGVLYSGISRSFSWSVADLMRMRLTAAVGLQRIVVEGYALLCLMRDDPAIAVAWSEVHTDAQGKAFHRKYNGAILAELERVGLGRTYERGSGMALHARFSGATFGLTMQSRREYSKAILETMVGHQELRPDNVFYFIVEMVSILDAHAVIFSNLAATFPDVDDPFWRNSRVPDFIERVRQLWGRFWTAFPDQMADLERRHGPLAPRFGPKP